jgi:hypothetical protein
MNYGLMIINIRESTTHMLYAPLALPQAQHIANGAYIQPLNIKKYPEGY